MNYTEILNQIKEWACSLIILQYRNAPKNRELIKLLVDLVFANNIILQVRNGFDLGYANTIIRNDSTPTTLKDALVYYGTFFAKIKDQKITDDFKFQYLNNNWVFHNQNVTLSDYGIKIIGTPSQNDIIYVNYTPATAEGTQLDIIGKWVGIDRYYDAIDLWEQNYTALVNYSNISSDEYEQWQGGFSSYSQSSPNYFGNNDGGFLTYAAWKETRTKVNQMGDDYFRQLIKLKIIKNSIACTNKNIDDAIWQWSGGTVYTTWGTMEVTYHYPKSMHNLFQLAIYKNVLLAPTGCTINIEEI